MQYDFSGRKNIVKFLKLVREAGLYSVLRIGPYVCAEWNYGGFPLWLHFIPGIEFRTDNEPFKQEMQRFTSKIVEMLKQEKLFASQGGPIILAQIENEYGNGDIEKYYGDGAKPYVDWAASMAQSMNIGVPWVMCQQPDAPDPLINTCNGFYCHDFVPNSDKKPKMWTENWTGWFTAWAGPLPYRPAEDIAFAVARFFQLNGTFQNYYMYHGGTNFGRTSGGPFLVTSYDYDAPLDEYGFAKQPKWGHLKDLHKAIKLCEEAMLTADPTTSTLATNVEATVYETGSGLCAAFLANSDHETDATVNFGGISYTLPAWSVSILPDCKHEAFNTAKMNAMTMVPEFVINASNDTSSGASLSGWSWANEPVGTSRTDAFSKVGLADQINTTSDKSDYLWYSFSTNFTGSEPVLQGGSQTILHVESLGHGLYAFVNGKFAGSRIGNVSNISVFLETPISLAAGENTIDLLSLTVGLQNYGAFFDKKGAGITGPVLLKGSENGSSLDLSSQKWTYQIGLKNEGIGLPSGTSTLWNSQSPLPTGQPFVWYKANFNAPSGDSPVAINMSGMGKGEVWVNGNSLGRYWPAGIDTSNDCSNNPCDYRGVYNSEKCLSNCGNPSQIFYHIPRDWLKPSGNVLVMFEEMGGDPSKISLATRTISSICSVVSETHPPPIDAWNPNLAGKPTLSLQCPFPKQVISSIKFASYGTPTGTCGNFANGDCNSNNSLSIVQKACLGSSSCKVEVSDATFGDPCVNVTKTLAVEAFCK